MDQNGHNTNKFPKKKHEKPLQTVSKTKTCNKHVAVCTEKRENKSKTFPPNKTVEKNTKNPGSNSTEPNQKFGMEGGRTNVKLLR